ncbi:hypothetical protein [Phragmitibacter flavus]|nr:hypothetical protein [Phragmitibacter flavus]
MYEGNGLGAGDELAQTGEPVRGKLAEPDQEFIYAKPGDHPKKSFL